MGVVKYLVPVRKKKCLMRGVNMNIYNFAVQWEFKSNFQLFNLFSSNDIVYDENVQFDLSIIIRG